MDTKNPENNSHNPQKVDSQPTELQTLFKKLAILKDTRNTTEPTDPNYDLNQFTLRKTEVNVLQQTEALPQMLKIDALGGDLLRKGGFEAANDPKSVSLVKKSMEIERKALNGEDISNQVDFVKYGTEKEDFEKIGQEHKDAIVASNAQAVDQKTESFKHTEIDFNIDTPLVTVNSFTEEEQNEAKTKWIRENPEEHAKDLSERIVAMRENEKLRSKKILKENELDFNLQEIEDEEKKKKASWEINGPIDNRAKDPDFVIPLEQLQKEPEAKTYPKIDLSPTDLAFRMKDAGEKMEERRSGLERRGKKAQENLEKMGLTNIEKGLAAWKKVHPGYKMALGLALGASGLGAVSVGLSALTFTEKGYSERREALEKEGKMESKYWTLTKSTGIGLLLALGTSHLSQLVGTAVSEHASGVMDSVRNFFSGAPIPVSAPVVDHFDPSTVNPLTNEVSPGFQASQAEISPNTSHPNVSLAEVDQQGGGVSVDRNTSSSVVSGGNLDAQPSSQVLNSNGSSVQGSTQNAVVENVVANDNFTTPDTLSSGNGIPFGQSPNHLLATDGLLGSHVDFTSPITLDAPYTMMPGDSTDTVLYRVLNSVDELKVLPFEDKIKFINDMKEQWSTPISGASTPNWALKEMATAVNGTEIHHLDHVRDAFVTLGERAHIITTYRH